MSFGPHRFLETVVPDFATPLTIITVPLEGRAAMKLTKFTSQFLDALGFQENMVMVGKYAPCIYA
jgi:hypothetical protein